MTTKAKDKWTNGIGLIMKKEDWDKQISYNEGYAQGKKDQKVIVKDIWIEFGKKQGKIELLEKVLKMWKDVEYEPCVVCDVKEWLKQELKRLRK